MLTKYGYDSNTPYSKLKTLFYHFEKSGYNFQEQSFPHFSSPKWEMDAANYLLTYRRGNCHRYSALMANLARAVGYDAVAQYHYYIKIISGIRNWTHAWTEVIDDQGVAYVCDAEIRIEIVRQRGYGTAAFMEKKSTIGNYGPGYLTYYYAWGITEGGGKEYSLSRAAKSDDRSSKTPRIDLGNNPMVGATVACAVAVEVAMKG